jgi:hypothetical protein
VLAANLLCRLPDPSRFLARLPTLVAPGGVLVLASPYSWLEAWTQRQAWLGGYVDKASSRDRRKGGAGGAWERDRRPPRVSGRGVHSGAPQHLTALPHGAAPAARRSGFQRGPPSGYGTLWSLTLSWWRKRTSLL